MLRRVPVRTPDLRCSAAVPAPRGLHRNRKPEVRQRVVDAFYGGGVARQCSRTGCSDHAAVTLTYQYDHAQVWLDALSDERDPHGYDLCARHAGRLTVPQGWQVLDRRVPARPDLIAV